MYNNYILLCSILISHGKPSKTIHPPDHLPIQYIDVAILL